MPFLQFCMQRQSALWQCNLKLNLHKPYLAALFSQVPPPTLLQHLKLKWLPQTTVPKFKTELRTDTWDTWILIKTNCPWIICLFLQIHVWREIWPPNHHQFRFFPPITTSRVLVKGSYTFHTGSEAKREKREQVEGISGGLGGPTGWGRCPSFIKLHSSFCLKKISHNPPAVTSSLTVYRLLKPLCVAFSNISVSSST